MASTLRFDTALYGSAVLLDRLLGFFLLPLLTRAISPADYGAWTQTAVTSGLLVSLVLYGAPTVVVRYFSGTAAVQVRRRYFLRLGGLAGLAFGVCVLLALALSEPLARVAYGESGRHGLVPLLLVLLAADATTEFCTAWLRTAGRIGGVAAALVLRSAVRYGVVLLLVGDAVRPLTDWLGSYAASQLGLAVAVALATAWALRGAGASPPPAAGTAPAPGLHELLAYATPLVALSLFTSLNGLLDRFLLVQWLGLDIVAVYAAAVSLCGIPAAFYSVLGYTLFPVLARHWQDGRLDAAAALMSQALRVFLFLCVPVAAWLAAAGHWVLPLLATGDYHAPVAVFVCLGVSVAAFGSYQILLYALLLDGRSRQVLGLTVGATALNLVLNLWLARRYGVAGAAGAVALSNLVMIGVALRLVRRVLPWQFPWAALWTIASRAALAVLPLAGLMAADLATPARVAAATALGATAYLALDWRRPDSIARQALGR